MTMQMIRGYAVPRPDAGDGEYGAYSVGACHGCDVPGMHGFAASPVAVPYWAMQNIDAPVPALNGYFAEAPSQDKGIGWPMGLAVGVMFVWLAREWWKDEAPYRRLSRMKKSKARRAKGK